MYAAFRILSLSCERSLSEKFDLPVALEEISGNHQSHYGSSCWEHECCCWYISVSTTDWRILPSIRWHGWRAHSSYKCETFEEVSWAEILQPLWKSNQQPHYLPQVTWWVIRTGSLDRPVTKFSHTFLQWHGVSAPRLSSWMYSNKFMNIHWSFITILFGILA